MSILEDYEGAPDIRSMVENIPMPSMEGLALDLQSGAKDIFGEHDRKAWNAGSMDEARCDFKKKIALTRRSDVLFVTVWQKSVVGRTLKDIKADDAMVTFFANSIAPIISDMVGCNLHAGKWAICTTPRRRHLEMNFAERVISEISGLLGIPAYADAAHARSKQRIGAVFDPANIPAEPNIIVYDDIVTTGQTLLAMRNLLNQHGKNTIFFSNINNKL